MLVKTMILLTALSMCTVVSAEPLDRETIIPELLYSGLGYLDYHQTKRILHSNGKFVEINPMIRHPRIWNHNGIRNYFLVSSVVHIGASYALPPWWRKRYQLGSIVLQAAVVMSNLNIGLEF